MCRHDLATGQTRYDRETNRLRYTLVCDGCQQVIRETPGPEYKPDFAPAPSTKEA